MSKLILPAEHGPGMTLTMPLQTETCSELVRRPGYESVVRMRLEGERGWREGWREGLGGRERGREGWGRRELGSAS